ncbi:MAG: hypothetical protein ACNYZG_12000, partial [Gammaproteobacteria bacterium]
SSAYADPIDVAIKRTELRLSIRLKVFMLFSSIVQKWEKIPRAVIMSGKYSHVNCFEGYLWIVSLLLVKKHIRRHTSYRQ